MDNHSSFFEANREGWNLRTEVHKTSDFYNVEGWKSGQTSLTPIELSEIGGQVAGKRLLHLQCHFGQDTLSWARLGAQVTGCDLSDKAIDYARELAAETGLDASFVCCNVYDLPAHLEGQFDIVFTSYGTIGWLPDLDRWAAVVNHFLAPGGFFYIADFHPFVWMLDDDLTFIKYSYFNDGVIVTESTGSYTDRYADIKYTEYGWNHPTSEVLNCLLRQGLQLEFFNEFGYSPYNCFSNMVEVEPGKFHIKGLEGKLPMVFSLKMGKGG